MIFNSDVFEKFDFLSFSALIRIETHFPLYSPVNDFPCAATKIIAQIIWECVDMMNHTKKEASSANSLAFVVKSSEWSLI